MNLLKKLKTEKCPINLSQLVALEILMKVSIQIISFENNESKKELKDSHDVIHIMIYLNCLYYVMLES